MSLNHKDHLDYWKDIGPRLDTFIAGSLRQDVMNVIISCVAFYGFVSEDIKQKITQNQSISPKLDLFIVFAFDQLRAALPLYGNLSLAPSAIVTRAIFENMISHRFIVQSSTPSVYADRYARFKDIIRLKAHRNSTFLGPISQTEEQTILAANPEWVDPATGKLFKKVHWTGNNNLNVEQMVIQVGMQQYYSIYRSTSQFMHSSPITVNMYKGPTGIHSIGKENRVRQMTLLTGIMGLETLRDHCDFFGVTYDQQYYFTLAAELNRIAMLP